MGSVVSNRSDLKIGGICWFASCTVKGLSHSKLSSPTDDANEKPSSSFRLALPFASLRRSLSRALALCSPTRSPLVPALCPDLPCFVFRASLHPSLSQSGPPSMGVHRSSIGAAIRARCAAVGEKQSQPPVREEAPVDL
ncbi:hypothetical protein BDA96_06G175100 [Sorghum bicolor]|uniref:Uncharacterized protein n=1 Tax=Sorghum bicolor TaxID=4558 RepID=A0A921QRH9_SORBI|nr:hypothetical protein BDA96_06G175100 [Sorghum bicolor]